MANILKSFVAVKGNEKVENLIDSLIDKVGDDDTDNPIAAFSKAFYEDVELSDKGGVMNNWSFDNLGSKWTTLYDASAIGEFSLESAWYPPKQFFIHLYHLCFPLDNDVVIEVTYEDESFDPVGALVIKGVDCGEEYDDKQGCIWVEETTLEDPTIDMDWEDENYEQTQMEFYDEVAHTQVKLLEECLRLVETDGELIDNYEG